MTKNKKIFVNSKTLGEHPFVQQCFRDGLAADRAIGVKKSLSVKPLFPREPTESEYFALGVSSSVAQLLNSCYELEDCLIYLGTSNITPRMQRLGISKHRYIRYTMENFIIRTQSLHGRVLYLIDATFHLGNPDELVTHRLIAGNVHVRMSPVSKNLKDIKKILEQYHFVRNEIIHHRSYDEDSLRKLEAYTILQDAKDQTYRIHSQALARAIASTKRRKYAKFVQTLFMNIERLFDNLNRVYSKQKKRLT